MKYQPDSFVPATPDAEARDAMRTALREFKALVKTAPKPVEHPLRTEMLAVLADARARIDRINAPAV